MQDTYEGFITPKNQELTFPNEVEREMFRTLLEKFDGENLWLRISAKTPTRSQRQNRFYWTYLEHLSEQTGHSANELHIEFKHAFLKPQEKSGITGKYKETPTTKNLSKREFNDYIREIEMLTEIPAPSKSQYNL